ncbi:MAG: cytochrome c nitrite reductase small subunit [Anaerolineae bacterium]|nr:cytochrome c nitrite reductase small subunit [Anaerolineae bacterium]MDW8099534.1 cytochrome c nitrite reductase small subunit [Anaerolineae bacterium]
MSASFKVNVSFGMLSLLVAVLGILVGLGAYTFVYARGFSYFSDDPKACLNCHVMRDAFDGWRHSSHRSVATCNDCHTPHTFPGKWLVKGINGWNHSVAFTTGDFPDPIRIREFNARIAQQNCVECHEVLVSQIHRSGPHQELSCVFCHGNVGHGR